MTKKKKIAVNDKKTIQERLKKFNELCKQGGGLPGIPAILPKGTIVVRSVRGHNKRKKSELSYKPVDRCDTFQRATIKGETAFYACIGEDKNAKNAFSKACVLCMTESSNGYRLGIVPLDKEEFTISEWVLKRDIYIVSFITTDTFPNEHGETLEGFRRVYEKNVADKKYNKKQIELLKLLNDEFTRTIKNGEEDEYQITAYTCHRFLSNFDADGYRAEAILYPPVQMQGMLGLNVAIRPDIADDAIELIRVSELTYYANDKDSCNLDQRSIDISKIDISN